jgi:hypothetical protein
MLKITHVDPSLHTAAAYMASADGLTEVDPLAANLLRDMADVQRLLDNPTITFHSPTSGIAFSIRDYAQSGVIVSEGGRSRSVFDEELRDVVRWAGNASKLSVAMGVIGDPETFARQARHLEPGKIEHDQVQVFGERLDSLMRKPSPPQLSTESSNDPLIQLALNHGDYVQDAILEVNLPQGAGPFPDKLTFQPTFAGPDSAIYAERLIDDYEPLADIIVRKERSGFSLQIDGDGLRQIIAIERAEDTAAHFAMSVQHITGRGWYSQSPELCPTFATPLIEKLVEHDLLPAEFNLRAYFAEKGVKLARIERVYVSFEDILGRDNHGHPIAVPPLAGPSGTSAVANETDERHLKPVELPRQVESERTNSLTPDGMRIAMINMIEDAIGQRRDWTFQLQVSFREVEEAASQFDNRSEEGKHNNAGTPTLQSLSTINTIVLLADAIRQPEFSDKPNGSHARTGTEHEGIAGLQHLQNSFGPADPATWLEHKIPDVAMLHPEYAAVINDEDFGYYDDWKNLIQEAGRRVFNVATSGITNTTPTRALHLDAIKAADVIRSIPDEKVCSAYQEFREANRNNITRVDDRRRMNQAAKTAQVWLEKKPADKEKDSAGIDR